MTPRGSCYLVEEACELLRSKKHTDFSPFCEGYEFLVHRIILSQKSPFFQAVFDNGFREKSDGYMNIGETTPVALAAIIIFCYTNKLNSASGRAAFPDLSPHSVDKKSQVYRDRLLDIYLLADRLLLADLSKQTPTAFIGSLAILKTNKTPFGENICMFLRGTYRRLPVGDVMLKSLVSAWAVAETGNEDFAGNVYDLRLEEDEYGCRAAQFIRHWKEGSSFVDAATETVEEGS